MADESAKQVWGRWNADRTAKVHSFGQVTFSEVTEPERLLALTRRALVEASQPKVSYEVDVAALDGDDADLGDTVAVIDTSCDPEWRLTARVVRRVRTFDEQVVARVTESTPISFTPLRRLQAAIVLGPVGPLELLGAEVSQRRVGPYPVVEALDVLEDLERRPLSALEGARVHALGLDDAHERLHRRVVPGDDIEPIDGSIPASRMVFPSSSEAYCDPWSLWCTQPLPGLLRAMAILSASSASSAAMLADIDQPTIILDHTSITTAR